MVREAPQHCSRQLRPADPSGARTGLEELRTHGPWVRLHPLQFQVQAESSPPTCLQNSVPPGSPSRVQTKPSEWSFNRKGTGKALLWQDTAFGQSSVQHPAQHACKAQ